MRLFKLSQTAFQTRLVYRFFRVFEALYGYDFLLCPREGRKHCDESVCLFAWLDNHTAELHQIFMHVACGHGSVSPLQRLYMLSSSGFVDDVILFISWGGTARIKHDVRFRKSSPSGCIPVHATISQKTTVTLPDYCQILMHMQRKLVPPKGLSKSCIQK